MWSGSTRVIVAVVDAGFDVGHPDLASNLWVNAKEVPGDGLDNDHNGYPDDVHGWDFVDRDPLPLPNNADQDHGTMVAGVIGAVGNNRTTYRVLHGAAESWPCA